MNQVFRPHTIQGKTIVKPSKGLGMGALLLDGGKGSGNTYHSVDDYFATTNRPTRNGGQGLGAGNFKDKLDSLLIKSQPKKPKNIKFNM